jgi:AraC-like DNA-binding protein
MSATIPTYASMQALYAALGTPLPDGPDFSIHPFSALHASTPFRSPLFRAHYYTIVLVRRGRGRYFVDEQTYRIRARTLYFTNPGHVKGFELAEPIDGFVITFGESFLKRHTHAAIFDDLPFLLSEIAPPQYPSKATFTTFHTLAAQLLHEFHRSGRHRFRVIGSLLVALLLKIDELYRDTYATLNPRGRASAIVPRFQQVIEKHFREAARAPRSRPLRVGDCARALHLNANYLNTVIRAKTGRTVQSWIIEKTIAEASTLLLRTSLTAQEIGYRLGFAEPGHFSRYFKQHTGLSPLRYRAQSAAPPA